MPSNRRGIPPEFAAQVLETHRTSSSSEFLTVWSKGLNFQPPTQPIVAVEASRQQHRRNSDDRSEACDFNAADHQRVLEDSTALTNYCAASARGRAPVPYAPLHFRWPHTAVLDLIVQQALAPFDPNLDPMEAATSHAHPCRTSARQDDAAALLMTEVSSLIHHCSSSSTHGSGGSLAQEETSAPGTAIPLSQPHLTLGFQGFHQEVPANGIPLWDKLSLEPYGSPKPVLYYVLCPEHLVPLAHMFMREVASEYSACQLGYHSAGPSSPTLRALGGIIPVPLTAPDCVLPGANDGFASGPRHQPGPWFHPLLGASSNHAAGFHPGLEDNLGQAAAAGSCSRAGRGAGMAATQPTSCCGSGANGSNINPASNQDQMYCRNLRHSLDMLQRQLLLNPPPEPLHAVRLPAPGSSDSRSGGGEAVSVVVYIVAPTSQPGAAVRTLLEAACRLAPVTPSAAAAASAAAAGHGSSLDGASNAADPGLGPMTPPLLDTSDEQQQKQAVQQVLFEEHLKEQLEEGKRYFGAASDNYWPLLPEGTSGLGAAGATSVPMTVPRNLPPTLCDLGPRTCLDVTLQPLDLAVFQDVSGAAARATAFSVYSKLRRLPSALSRDRARPAASPAPLDALPSSAREGAVWEASIQPEASSSGRRHSAVTATPPYSAAQPACGRGGATTVLAASSGCSRVLYEPLAALSATPQAPGGTLAGELQPVSSTGLHCSYSWHFSRPTGGADGSGASASASSSLPRGPENASLLPLCRTWLSMAWTDGCGELLESKVVALSTSYSANERGGAVLGAAALPLVPGLAAAAAAVSSQVLAECQALLDRLNRHEPSGSGDSPGVGTNALAPPLPAFDRLYITKAGPMAAGEAAAWKLLLATWHEHQKRMHDSAASGLSVLVTSLDQVQGLPVDLSLDLPQGSYLLRTGSSCSAASLRPPASVKAPPQLMQLLLFPSSSPQVLGLSGAACRPMAGDGKLWRLCLSLVLDTSCDGFLSTKRVHGAEGQRHKRQRVSSQGAADHKTDVAHESAHEEAPEASPGPVTAAGFWPQQQQQQQPRLSKMACDGARELHALTILNASLHSLGRSRQVSPYGSGLLGPSSCGGPDGVEGTEGWAFMPFHCCVASKLLSLCLVCEDVLEGKICW